MEGIGVGIDGSEVGGEARIVLCSCGAASTGNGNGFRTDRNAFVLVPVSPMSGLAFGERSEVIKVRGGRCESHRSLARLRPSAAWLMLRRKSAWSFERFPSATVCSGTGNHQNALLPGLATEERRRKEKSRSRRRSSKRGRVAIHQKPCNPH